MEDIRPAAGSITTRKCPTCGHHEVGFTTNDGVFHPFKEGDFVQVIDRSVISGSPPMNNDLPQTETTRLEDMFNNMEVWIPEPLRNDKLLRCKFGVYYDREPAGGKMSSAVYEVAFKLKIQYLLEKEIYTPLPVILDQFFGAPNLANGETEEIAQALWDELEEIRRPAGYVCDWIENQNNDNLARMIHPRVIEEMKDVPVSDEQIKQELSEITLEDFFEMLN
ncbi:hypothetical protein ACFL1Z_03870 [Thermodesulfobacteriota bacterium]